MPSPHETSSTGSDIGEHDGSPTGQQDIEDFERHRREHVDRRRLRDSTEADENAERRQRQRRDSNEPYPAADYETGSKGMSKELGKNAARIARAMRGEVE